MADPVEKHFVEFASPGTFVPETTLKEIDSWDVEKAIAMSRDVLERYNARPFGFRFITRSRGPNDLDSSVSTKSPFYWLGGRVRTVEEVLAGSDPSEDILRSNVRINGVRRIIENGNSWKHTSILNDDDIVLDYAP